MIDHVSGQSIVQASQETLGGAHITSKAFAPQSCPSETRGLDFRQAPVLEVERGMQCTMRFEVFLLLKR